MSYKQFCINFCILVNHGQQLDYKNDIAALTYIVNNNLANLLHAGTQQGQMGPKKENALFVYDMYINTWKLMLSLSVLLLTHVHYH